MELIIAGAIAGVLLAIALFKVVWIVASRAVDNLFRWTIYTFGNDEAVKHLRAKNENRK